MPDVLIASGFGDAISGGGLFAIDGSRVDRIDRVATMGLSFDGRRLARAFRCPPQDAIMSEIAVYDERGVQRYLRVDQAAAVHDIAWDEEAIVIVSSWDNAVRWVSPAGDIVREVRYPGPYDSWHVNCVTRHEGLWYATIFGDLRAFRESVPLQEGLGRIVNLTTGRTIVDGLTAPHTPRWIDGMWVVCNSGQNELLGVDGGSGRVVRRFACDLWTRGIAYDERFIYVGACRRRASEESFGDAQILVIDRATWKPVDRIAVPAQEIYDLVFVPRAMYAGLQRGFDVNPRRTAEFRQFRIMNELGVEEPRSLWPSGDPLPWTDFRCTVACEIATTCTAGELFEVQLRVTNRSASFFTSAPPSPIYASYKWLDPETGEYLAETRAHRSKLPRTIFPHETVDMTALITVPRCAGTAILRVTLMQEGVSWFDDHDSSNAAAFLIEIAPAEQERPRIVTPIVT